MDDSSSESPMEEGSMEGLEHHEYDEYELEADDDEVDEDEFEDGHDDDDDEGIDDDDEDSSDPPNVPLELPVSGSVSEFVNQIRMGHHHRIAALDHDPVNGPTAEIQFSEAFSALPGGGSYNVLTVDAMPTPITANESFDSRVRETAAWLTAMDAHSFWNFVNNHALPGNHHRAIAGPGISARSSHFHHDNDSGYNVHPALSRPRSLSAHSISFAGLLNNDAADDLNSPLESFANHHFNPSASTSVPRNAGNVNVSIHNPTLTSSRTASSALDDARSSLNTLLNIISPEDAHNNEVPTAQTDVSNGAQSRNTQEIQPNARINPATAPTPTPRDRSGANAEGIDQVLPQNPTTSSVPNASDQFSAQMISLGNTLQSTLENMHGGGGSYVARSFVLPSQAAAMEMPWDMEIGGYGGPGIGPGSHSPFSFMRRSMGSRMNRERDRGTSTRRWTYDPPGNGGDDLPSMFTGESPNQRNHHGHGTDRRSSSTPFASVAAESFESVNRLETKIISRLASLSNELRKIDQTASKEISDAKKKKEKAEKKAKAKEEAKKNKDKQKTKAAKDQSDKPAEETAADPAATDTAAPVTAAELTDSPQSLGIDPDELLGSGVDRMQTEPDGEDLPTRAAPDTAGNTSNVEENQPEAIEIDAPEATTTNPAENAVTGDTSVPAEETAGAATEGTPNPEFTSVAAARAAAIGISLDAPANEDPNVIMAATESTGIDPTFFLALPEEMRQELFNELFGRMRDTAPASGGAAEASDTTLNRDFLIALPPNLRAEVLEAEADYQARNAPAANQGGAGNAAGNGGDGAPGDQMDNATFLATLTPDLRDEILLTSGEEFLASLPPELAAEARELRDREAANHLQHQGWVHHDEPPTMFRRGSMSGGFGYPGRRATRVSPSASANRDLGMRWEKVDDRWYRVGPKQEEEVKSSLNDEGLKSVVRLLKLSKNTFGKHVINTVLTSACKNANARKQVLTELLTMITQVKDKSESEKEEESPVYASEGTVVRRALELLHELCKSDTTVAETLIGLANPPEKKQDENLENVDDVIDMVKPSNLLSLSTLTSLLSTPLFMRSNVHLEQLLNVISLVCKAVPSARPNKPKRNRLRRFLGQSVSALTNLLQRIDRFGDDDEDEDEDEDDEEREARRQFIEELEVGLTQGDRPITSEEARAAERHLMVMEDIDPEIEAYREFRRLRNRRRGLNVTAPDSDDSSDEEEEQEESGNQNNNDSEEEVAETENNNNENDDEPNVVADHGESGANNEGNAGATEAQVTEQEVTPANTAAPSKKKKKEKKPEVRIPVEFRVPQLCEKDLNALVVVLRRANCKDDVYEQVSNSLAQLGELPDNRAVTIAALANSAQDLGVSVREAYVAIKEELKNRPIGVQKDIHKKRVISKFAMGTSTCELMLLRLVKTAATLLNITSKKDKAGSKSKAKNEKKEKGSTNDPKVLAELKESKDQVFRSLQDLWMSLYDVLDLVESELDTPSLDKKKENLRRELSSRRRTEGLARQTRTRNSRKSLSPVLARLSPTIEAFFVTHSTLIEGEDETTEPSEMVMSPRPMSPLVVPGSPAPSEPGDQYPDLGLSKSKQLGAFLSRHRVPINALLRSNPSLLETSFKLALKHSQTIDFDNKQAYFKNLIRKRSSEAHASTLRISVRRDYVYMDSYRHLKGKSKEQMKGRLHVQFTGEEGIDAGGVTREWYTILARQIFDANYALFCRSAAKAATYQPDKRSYINDEHLENFKFVGRFVAKAIYDGQLIDAYFTRAFYKHILGIKPTYRDIEAQDPDFYKSLKWMLENDITGVLDHTMSAEYEEFGQRKVVDLIPNGRNVAVTEDNKADYVRAVTEVRLTRAIEKQIKAFKDGFHELIPLEDCKIFNELELELLMSGLPDIDMADLKANVEYTGYTSSSPQINWFWRCVSQCDQEDLARLVMFVTGTSKVPLEGFSALQGMNGPQKFQIHRVAGDTNRLPSAHTCFNQLDLPEYSSAEVLSERLLKAVRECHVGFGFA